VGSLPLRFLLLLSFFVPKQGKSFFTLSDSPVAMTSVLSNTEVDTDQEDLPKLEHVAANATTNRNTANQTHGIQGAETTSGYEQMNDRIMHTQEVLLGSIQGDHMCCKTNFRWN
jgi:hypothetical protein